MNRRSFLKFCGIAPVVPGLVVEALEPTQKIIGVCCWGNHKFPVTAFKVESAPGCWVVPGHEETVRELMNYASN